MSRGSRPLSQRIVSMSAENQLDQSSASRAGPARQHDVVPEAAAVRAPGTELGDGAAASVRGLPG